MFGKVPKRSALFLAAIMLTFVAVRFAAMRQLHTDAGGRISDPAVVADLRDLEVLIPSLS